MQPKPLYFLVFPVFVRFPPSAFEGGGGKTLQSQETQETQGNIRVWDFPDSGKSGNTRKYKGLRLSSLKKERELKEI